MQDAQRLSFGQMTKHRPVPVKNSVSVYSKKATLAYDTQTISIFYPKCNSPEKTV
jgi:hypothetical protein